MICSKQLLWYTCDHLAEFLFSVTTVQWTWSRSADLYIAFMDQL